MGKNEKNKCIHHCMHVQNHLCINKSRSMYVRNICQLPNSERALIGPLVMFAVDGNDFLKIIIGAKAVPATLIAQLMVVIMQPFDWEWAYLEP